jgi:hypothetical protein
MLCNKDRSCIYKIKFGKNEYECCFNRRLYSLPCKGEKTINQIKIKKKKINQSNI